MRLRGGDAAGIGRAMIHDAAGIVRDAAGIGRAMIHDAAGIVRGSMRGAAGIERSRITTRRDACADRCASREGWVDTHPCSCPAWAVYGVLPPTWHHRVMARTDRHHAAIRRPSIRATSQTPTG
jgi:hypothetical protein